MRRSSATHWLIPAHAGKTPRRSRPQPHRGAHPRSRGENLAGRVPLGGELGSSPLTRGKPRRRCASSNQVGLIPAHAGKTTDQAADGTQTRAHPRSRGENRRILVDQWSRWGSSPLTRGKPHGRPGRSFRRRLIPAHAGKTTSVAAVAVTLPGSSPLTRGKPAGQAVGGHRRGLIPAHAGKTS